MNIIQKIYIGTSVSSSTMLLFCPIPLAFMVCVEAETPILWPPDAKSWLIWKDPNAGKDWRQEDKGTTEDEWLDGISDLMDMSE